MRNRVVLESTWIGVDYRKGTPVGENNLPSDPPFPPCSLSVVSCWGPGMISELWSFGLPGSHAPSMIHRPYYEIVSFLSLRENWFNTYHDLTKASSLPIQADRHVRRNGLSARVGAFRVKLWSLFSLGDQTLGNPKMQKDNNCSALTRFALFLLFGFPPVAWKRCWQWQLVYRLVICLLRNG